MKLNPKVNVPYQGEFRGDKIDPKLWTKIGSKMKLLALDFSFINAPYLGRSFQATFSHVLVRGGLRMSSPRFRQWLLELLLLPTYWMTEK